MNNQNYTKSLKSVRDFIYRNYMEKEKLISFVDFRGHPKSTKDCSLHSAMIIWCIMAIRERCAQSESPSSHSVSRFQNCSIFQSLNYILNLLPLTKIWLMMWLSKYCSEQWKKFVIYNVHSGINPVNLSFNDHYPVRIESDRIFFPIWFPLNSYVFRKFTVSQLAILIETRLTGFTMNTCKYSR